MQNYTHYAIGFRQFLVCVSHAYSIAGMGAAQG